MTRVCIIWRSQEELMCIGSSYRKITGKWDPRKVIWANDLWWIHEQCHCVEIENQSKFIFYMLASEFVGRRYHALAMKEKDKKRSNYKPRGPIHEHHVSTPVARKGHATSLLLNTCHHEGRLYIEKEEKKDDRVLLITKMPSHGDKTRSRANETKLWAISTFVIIKFWWAVGNCARKGV